MKPSTTRLKLIAGAFGVLCVSQPGMSSAQGVPLSQAGTPVGENATPVGQGSLRVGEGAVSIGEGAVPIADGAMKVGEGATPTKGGGRPVGEDATPDGQGGIRVGEGATPTKGGGLPVGEGATPDGQGGIRVGEGATPTKGGGQPVGEGATPDGQGGIPVGEGATPTAKGNPAGVAGGVPMRQYGAATDEASQRRLTNRSAAMGDPQTAGLFRGDAATRSGNVARNLQGAITGPAEDMGQAISQQDSADREWSRGAIASAASRPANLFSADWWAAHPDVLTGSNRYFTSKADFQWWQGSPWNDLVRVLGIRSVTTPFKYVNDVNIAFRNDVIYVNGQAVSSYEDFVSSARQIANTRPAGNGEREGWFPLGTFAVSVDPDQKTSSHAIQLAMDSNGFIAGVCVGWPQGTALPILGKVDINSQRVVFSIGSGSGAAVAETGLANLTDPYTRVWAHLPNSHSQTWLITRIRQGGQ